MINNNDDHRSYLSKSSICHLILSTLYFNSFNAHNHSVRKFLFTEVYIEFTYLSKVILLIIFSTSIESRNLSFRTHMLNHTITKWEVVTWGQK